MAISLISCEDNLTKTKIRCTVGCDYISDLDDIPVGDEDLSELGFANHKLAPWSFALVGEDGLLYYLTTTNKWKPYTNDGSGGGGGDKRMVITVTNESGEYSCDKTFEEIYNVGEANSVVIYDGYIYRQVVYTEEDIRYELTDTSSDAEMKIAHIDIVQDDSVEYHEYEIKSNKKLIVNCSGSQSNPSVDKTYEEIVANANNCELHRFNNVNNSLTIFNLIYTYENGTDSSYADFVYIDCDTRSGTLYIEKITVYKSGNVEYTTAQNNS